MPKLPGQSDHDALIRGARKGISEIVSAYAADRSVGAFGWRMLSLLYDGGAEATVLGRRRAGDDAPPEDDDRKFAWLALEEQKGYLDGFVEDLKDGRYEDADDKLDTDAIEKRAKLYSSRLTGIANEAYVLASDEEELWEWVLGGSEDHCGVCPERAANGPYKADELPGHPGDNSTPCKFNCLCSLKRSDGREGFKPTPL